LLVIVGAGDVLLARLFLSHQTGRNPIMSTRSLFTTTAVTAFTLAVALSSSTALAAGPPSGLNVNVVNPPSSPIPVTIQGTGTVSGTVNVGNPAAHPALTSSVDNPGRIPYQAQHSMDPSLDCNLPASECTFAPPAVPAGKRLVVQHVSALAFVSSGTFIKVFVQDRSTFALLSAFLLPLTPGSPSNAAGDQAVQFYLDAGSRLSAHVETDGDFGPNVMILVNLTGYLLDCAANQCAPIAP
jgi:hypothetical protein